MAEYTVRQMAEIWYETTVEATTPEEAIAIAAKGEVELDWWQIPDSTEFTDNFEVE
jgi:hypothetical protein